MIKLNRTSFLILCVLIIFASCRPVKELSVIGIDSFKLGKVSLQDGIDGSVGIKIKNPNNIGFSIYPSNFDIMYSGVKLGKVKLNKRVKIKSNAEKSYNLVLSSDLSGINYLDLAKLFNSDKAGKIEIKGNLRVGKFFIKKGYPINYTDKVSLSKMIEEFK